MSTLSDIRRYELKYIINEDIADQIREHIQHCCALDTHVPSGKTSYIVNNLYFDTPDLRFYHDTKYRKLTRFKPRARFYGNKAETFIWPEIKYRNCSIIWKERFKIEIDKWPTLFECCESTCEECVQKDAIRSFEDIIHWYMAESILHVRYEREPWVTQLEEYGRFTFDRNLSFRPTHGSLDLNYNEKDMIYYDDSVTSRSHESPVLLEIKVETHVPHWVIELIKKFQLTQRAFSKYCYALDRNMNVMSVM